MKVATSILSVKDNLKEFVDILNNTDTDYIHLDIMDGLFVPNKTWDIFEINNIFSKNKKPLDIHLMVYDVKKYVDDLSVLKPSYITFHYEAVKDIEKLIDYINSLGIKPGLAINPDTNVEKIYKFLPKIKQVLIMGVNPGFGGQEFISSLADKVNKLKEYKINNNFDYIISVDGGINDSTVKLVKSANMVVSGSYITNNDYNKSINILKNV